MQQFFSKYGLYLAIIPLGLLAGFLYWRFIGCNSGSCGITANWHSSMLMGGLLGYLLSDSVVDFRKKQVEKQS